MIGGSYWPKKEVQRFAASAHVIQCWEFLFQGPMLATDGLFEDPLSELQFWVEFIEIHA